MNADDTVLTAFLRARPEYIPDVKPVTDAAGRQTFGPTPAAWLAYAEWRVEAGVGDGAANRAFRDRVREKLADRVHKQSELLGRRAEKRAPA